MLDTASSIGYFLRELPFSPVSSASSAASICTTELFNLFLNKLDGARSIFIHLEWWCVHRLGVERTLQRDSRPKASVMPTTPKRRGSSFISHWLIYFDRLRAWIQQMFGAAITPPAPASLPHQVSERAKNPKSTWPPRNFRVRNKWLWNLRCRVPRWPKRPMT